MLEERGCQGRAKRQCVFRFIWCAAALLTGLSGAAVAAGEQSQQSPPHAAYPLAVLSVAGHNYTLEDLVGRDQATMRAEFDESVRTKSDGEIRSALFRFYGPLPESNRLPGMDRAALTEALWEQTFHTLLLTAAATLAFAHVTDLIAGQQGVKLDDYFDLKALRDAAGRQAGYMRELYEHRTAATASDAAFYAKMQEKYHLKPPQPGDITMMGQTLREVPILRLWSSDFDLRMAGLGDCLVKSVLAHYLLKDACEKGVYYRQARAVLDVEMGSTVAVEVTGYRGDPDKLRRALRTVVDDQGLTIDQGVREMDRWFKRTDPRVSVSERLARGVDVIDKDVPPTYGRMYQVAPCTYRVYGCAGPLPEPPEIMITQRAYSIAGRQFFPEARVVVKGWVKDMSYLGAALANDGPGLLSEPEIGQFVLRPYPGDVFDDEERNADTMDSLVADGFGAVGDGGDPAARARVVEQAHTKAGAATTATLRQRYAALGELLAERQGGGGAAP